MSLTNQLIKAGAMYALGRFIQNVKQEDVERVVGITGEDVRSFGLNRADAMLGNIGLMRQSTVPNSTALVLSGFAAGAIVGAGTTFLFYSEQGKDVRGKIAEFFGSANDDAETASGDTASTVRANGGAKAPV